jgi:hypothetical protein
MIHPSANSTSNSKLVHTTGSPLTVRKLSVEIGQRPQGIPQIAWQAKLAYAWWISYVRVGLQPHLWPAAVLHTCWTSTLSVTCCCITYVLDFNLIFDLLLYYIRVGLQPHLWPAAVLHTCWTSTSVLHTCWTSTSSLTCCCITYVLDFNLIIDLLLYYIRVGLQPYHWPAAVLHTCWTSTSSLACCCITYGLL